MYLYYVISTQENNRNESRQPRFGNRPGGGDDPGAPKKGPRFSIYWIYAIIFAVLIGFQLFGPFSPNMAKISSLEFRDMVRNNNGDIAKYVVIDNRKTVKVYLTPQGKTKYADKLKKNISGKIIVLELRYAGASWTKNEVVHVELCNFMPEDKPWKDRAQGVWVESHASYAIL